MNRGHRGQLAAIRIQSQLRWRTADRHRRRPQARPQPDRDSIQEPRCMTRIPAPSEPPATRRAGRRPIPVPPARTYGRKSKPGRNQVPASRRTGNSASPAPLPGRKRPGTATLSVRQHPTPTGATTSSTRPVSQDSLARVGPTAPPCTIRPNQPPQMPDLSQAGDLASVGHLHLGRSGRLPVPPAGGFPPGIRRGGPCRGVQ